MCDDCDCRSHPQIAVLSREHETLTGWLADLRRALTAGDDARSAALPARVHELLDDHAAREERSVFAELRRANVEGAYIGAFERDHDRIHSLLTGGTGHDWHRSAEELVDALHDHIAREETDLFPAAHQLLSPAQWDAVDATLSHPSPPSEER